MERFLELIFGSGLGLSAFSPDLLAIDQKLPKSEIYALFILNRRGQLTMSDLAAELGAPLSTVTGIATRLTKRWLIERERDPNDRRNILLQLTPEGRDLARHVEQQVGQFLARVQSALTPEEINILLELIGKVMRSLAVGPVTGQPGTEQRPRRIIIED